MTAADWLSTRTPRPPAALAARIASLLTSSDEDGDLPEALTTAAEQTLRALLHLNATDRAGALDLLAADALVTYAFEAAADGPETLEARATAAMHRLSSIATAL
ncbi:MAG: hypothetical protein ABI877_12285 [Gemmatimonadaceae bacterium]